MMIQLLLVLFEKRKTLPMTIYAFYGKNQASFCMFFDTFNIHLKLFNMFKVLDWISVLKFKKIGRNTAGILIWLFSILII